MKEETDIVEHYDENLNRCKSNKQKHSTFYDEFYCYAGVTFFSVCFLVLGPTCLLLLFVVPFFTEVWWPTIIYMTWWLWDLQSCNNGGRADESLTWLRNFGLMKGFVEYFPIKIFKTTEIPPTKNYIFCSHPHGVLCYGVFGAFASEWADVSKIFPGIKPKMITLEGSFWLPGFREMLLGIGACASSKKSLKTLLNSKQLGVAPVLMVGGLPEISNYHQNKIVLVIRKRLGFVKLALETGSDLVPLFSFGEAEIFHQPSGMNSFLEKVIASNIGFYPVVFSGRGFLQNSIGILPKRREINIVVGKPIEVEKIEEPSQEDIMQVHQQYIQQVVQLYEEHKKKYGYQDIELEII